MSYCRFTADSDVYAYECDGGVQFWVAGKENKHLDRLCNTFNGAYQYAKALRDEHGLKVTPFAIEALKSDAIDEAERINGPNSAVAEHIRDLESLVLDMYDALKLTGAHRCYYDLHMRGGGTVTLEERMKALGIEVE